MDLLESVTIFIPSTTSVMSSWCVITFCMYTLTQEMRTQANSLTSIGRAPLSSMEIA